MESPIQTLVSVKKQGLPFNIMEYAKLNLGVMTIDKDGPDLLLYPLIMLQHLLNHIYGDKKLIKDTINPVEVKWRIGRNHTDKNLRFKLINRDGRIIHSFNVLELKMFNPLGNTIIRSIHSCNKRNYTLKPNLLWKDTLQFQDSLIISNSLLGNRLKNYLYLKLIGALIGIFIEVQAIQNHYILLEMGLTLHIKMEIIFQVLTMIQLEDGVEK